MKLTLEQIKNITLQKKKTIKSDSTVLQTGRKSYMAKAKILM